MKLIIGNPYGKRIADVMEDVFGFRYASWQAYAKGYYIIDGASKGEEKYATWFPKMGNGISKGNPWINKMSSDGKYIFMKSDSELDMNKAESDAWHITFVKSKNSNDPYIYAGVFIRTHRDPELGWVYERIAEEIDISELPIIPRKTSDK